jgi:hypothetical protein
MSVVVNDAIVSNDGASKTYTYAELQLFCQDFCGDVSGTIREKLKRWINLVLGEMFTDAKPEWMLAQSAFDTVDEYTTGNATFTKGSKTVTFAGGAAILTAHVGRKLMRAGDTTGYVISSRDSATQVTMKHAYMGETATTVGFKIAEDTYSLASDFGSARIVDQHFTDLHLQVLEDLSTEFKVGRSPTTCKFTLDKNIVLYPAPDRIIKISYDFFRDYSKLTDQTATTHIPDQHVATLAMGVARNYWLSSGGHVQGAARKADQFAMMFEKGKEEIRKYRYMDDAKLVSVIPTRVVGSTAGSMAGWRPDQLID